MRKDPTEFRKRFAAWKNGKQPYKDGKPVVLNNYTNAKFNDDGTFTDDTTRVFDDFYVTPSGVKTVRIQIRIGIGTNNKKLSLGHTINKQVILNMNLDWKQYLQNMIY